MSTAYAHMIPPQRGWTAEELKDGSKINPGTTDHKGPKNHHTNEQPRHELYLLGPGEKKVTEEPDTSKSSYKSHIFPCVLVAVGVQITLFHCRR